MKKRVRSYFDFTEATLNKINTILEDTDCVSRAEVMRTAVKLYARFIERRKEGYRLYYQKNNIKERVDIL